MKKSLLLAMLIIAPLSAFAEDREFMDSMEPRIKGCEGHYSLTAVIESLHNDEKKNEIPPPIAAAIESGKVTLTAVQKQDPVAKDCASFAEGAIAISKKKSSPVLVSRYKACEGHFDMKSIVDGLSTKEDQDMPLITVLAIGNVMELGKIALSEAQQKDPIAIRCASFTEGAITEYIMDKFVEILSKAFEQATDQIIDKTIDSISEKNK